MPSLSAIPEGSKVSAAAARKKRKEKSAPAQGESQPVIGVIAEEKLTAAVRVALGAAIVESWFGAAGQIEVIGLDERLEQMLNHALANGGGMEPGLAQTLIEQAAQAAQAQADRGLAPVLVVKHDLRPLLARFLRRSIESLVVLSQSEIPDNRQLRVARLIGQAG